MEEKQGTPRKKQYSHFKCRMHEQLSHTIMLNKPTVLRNAVKGRIEQCKKKLLFREVDIEHEFTQRSSTYI